MIKKGLTLVLCGLVSVCGYSSASEPLIPAEQSVLQDKWADIDDIVKSALETFSVPGCAVGVIVNGRAVLSKGYGVRDREKQLPVTENTLFAIGSCTKAFTTFVLGQLVDEGVIAWDDLVVKYLPEFRLKDPYVTQHVTIRDLVTHRTGLPRHDDVWDHANVSRNELMERLQYLELSSDLREKFQYNNLMYVMAGLVIEKVTEQSWEEAVQSRIFVPLGMTRSNCSVQDFQMSEDFSLPYEEINGQVERVPFYDDAHVGPAGSINSSIVDMTKWMQLQLSDGSELIKKTTLQEMHTLQMADPSYPAESIRYAFGYGLGWGIDVYRGHYAVFHDGGVDGFISLVTLLPQEGIGIVVLSNNSCDEDYFVDGVNQSILDCLLDAKKEDWVAKFAEKRSRDKEAAQKSETLSLDCVGGPFAFDQYVGTYAHPAYGTVKIDLQDDSLGAEYHQFYFELQHNNYDVFKGIPHHPLCDPLSLQFFREVSGKISEVRIPLEPAVDPIVFKKMPNDVRHDIGQGG